MGKRNTCTNCANAYGTDYCTRQMDMNTAKYKKCSGWKAAADIPKKEKKISYGDILERRRRLGRAGSVNESQLSSKFRRFINKGGHFSARTGEIIVGGE